MGRSAGTFRVHDQSLSSGRDPGGPLREVIEVANRWLADAEAPAGVRRFALSCSGATATSCRSGSRETCPGLAGPRQGFDAFESSPPSAPAPSATCGRRSGEPGHPKDLPGRSPSRWGGWRRPAGDHRAGKRPGTARSRPRRVPLPGGRRPSRLVAPSPARVPPGARIPRHARPSAGFQAPLEKSGRGVSPRQAPPGRWRGSGATGGAGVGWHHRAGGDPGDAPDAPAGFPDPRTLYLHAP